MSDFPDCPFPFCRAETENGIENGKRFSSRSFLAISAHDRRGGRQRIPDDQNVVHHFFYFSEKNSFLKIYLNLEVNYSFFDEY